METAASEQALAACASVSDSYAARSPPGARAIRARIAHRRALRLPVRLFGAFRRYKRRARTSRGNAPFRASQGAGRRPSPYVIPTSVWRDRIGRTPVRLEGDRLTKPAPLFAAQPTKVFRRSLSSKRLERSRLKFFAKLFFKKAGSGWSGKSACRRDRRGRF